MRLRGHDIDKLREPGLLVVANHPTLLDAVFLMSFMPQADCVVKASHYDNFWLSGAARGAGYIPNRSGPQLVEECAERLRRGRSVLIFPEGTRSPKNGLGTFARGAAHIALRAGSDLVPVTIECDPATLYRGKASVKWPGRQIYRQNRAMSGESTSTGMNVPAMARTRSSCRDGLPSISIPTMCLNVLGTCGLWKNIKNVKNER